MNSFEKHGSPTQPSGSPPSSLPPDSRAVLLMQPFAGRLSKARLFDEQSHSSPTNSSPPSGQANLQKAALHRAAVEHALLRRTVGGNFPESSRAALREAALHSTSERLSQHSLLICGTVALQEAYCQQAVSQTSSRTALRQAALHRRAEPLSRKRLSFQRPDSESSPNSYSPTQSSRAPAVPG